MKTHLPSSPRARLAVICGAVALGFGSVAPVSAMSFAEAFDAAQSFDAQYRAAGYEREAAQLNVPIARSTLLPQVSFNYSNSTVEGTREFPNGLNQPVAVRVDYTAPQASLVLRAPIFNYEAINRFREAEASARGADQVFRAEGLELLNRLGTAYVQLLLSEEALSLSEQQVKAFSLQAERADQRFRRGEGTRTDIAIAQATLDVARVRVIEAADALEVARRDLRRIIGQDVPSLNRIPGNFVPAPLPQARLEDWLTMAFQQSPMLRAREAAIEAARFQIERARAGHLPKLDLVGSLSDSRNESLSSLNQGSRLRSIGVQLTVPIFSGFGIQAGMDLASVNRSRAQEALRSERESLELEVQRYFQAATAGTGKIEAHQRAVESSEVALLGATRALEAGFGTSNDVLDAQTRVYASLRELAQARYEYVVARIRLTAQAGMPVHEVVADVDRLLSVSAPPRKATTP